MEILVAPDSFKGSLSSVQASNIMKAAILDINKSYHVTMKPMADGGEGTLDSLLTSTTGKSIKTSCMGPLGTRINTSYAIVHSNTAIIEYASIAGLMQVPTNKRDPDFTTSYGLGEVIVDALNKGCTSFIIGIGGSATNDGGLGMLLALGMEARDESGNEVGPYGKDLDKVKKVSLSGIDPRLKRVNIKVACDVDNPLCGLKGASKIYGPQKGATAKQVKHYDEALDTFACLLEKEINEKYQEEPGAGAAGGLGFALLTIGGSLVSGAELLANEMDIEKAIMKADLVITGEGQSDEQTLYGKAPGYIASLAKKYNKHVVLISGSLDGDLDALRKKYSGCFSIINKPLSLEICMDQADKLLFEQVKQVVYLIERFSEP